MRPTIEQFNLSIAPHLAWLVLFAVGITGTALALKKYRPNGFSWWWRLSIIVAFVFLGHAIQAVTGLRGMPDAPSLLLFPLASGALNNSYYMYFRDCGLESKEASSLAMDWAMWHGFAIWGIAGSMIFLWMRLRPVLSDSNKTNQAT